MVPTARPDRRLTYDDFLLFPDGDGLRHEIIDGVHYVTPAPGLRHQDLVGRLHLAIGNFLASQPGLGRVFLSPLDVVFTFHDIVEPDLLFVAGRPDRDHDGEEHSGRTRDRRRGRVEEHSKRDERIKKELFDRGGVREYWIVDPDHSQLIVHRRDGARLADAHTALGRR